MIPKLPPEVRMKKVRRSVGALQSSVRLAMRAAVCNVRIRDMRPQGFPGTMEPYLYLH